MRSLRLPPRLRRAVTPTIVCAMALAAPLRLPAQPAPTGDPSAHAPGSAAARPSPALEAPAPGGPHAVGRRLVAWVDSSRREPTDTMRARAFVGWVWYPAARTGRTRTHALEDALPGAWGDLRAEASAAKLGEPAARALRALAVHATTDAPLARGTGRAPVLVFTPGNGWLPTDYGVLAEELASHGYVVVGVAPTGLADVVRLPDGRLVRKTLGVGAAVGVDQVHAHGDVLHVLGWLRRVDADASSFLHGRLDLARVGAFGHSLGGTTALVAAARDPLVRAAVNLDGDAMGVALDARPTQPLLFVSHEVPPLDEAPPAPDSAWRELTRQGLERSERRRTGEWERTASRAAHAYRVRVLGMRHLGFTDAALASALIAGPERRWMRWGPIDGGRGLRITAELVRHFFDDALGGRPAGASLRALAGRYPELRLEDERPGPATPDTRPTPGAFR